MKKIMYVNVRVSFPTVNELNTNNKPKKYKITEFQYDDETIYQKDDDVNTFMNECLYEMINDDFPEDYEDGVGIYYISEETYNTMTDIQKKKYETVHSDIYEMTYIIPKPIVEINECPEMEAETIEEKLAEVGMSMKDFL